MEVYNGKWLQKPEHLLFEVADRVATITLNRPEKRNALSQALLGELHDAMMEADARTDVSVIILAGAGKDFCSGFDLDGVYSGRKEEGLAAEQSSSNAIPYRGSISNYDNDVWNLERMRPVIMMPFTVHKPTIAKVHGNCLAGGIDIALSCDMVIAASNARIGFPATRANGSPPTHMWIYHCGPQWAKRLLLSGDSVTGADAAKIGLIMDAYPADELDAETCELARRLALVDVELLAANKRIVNGALEAMGVHAVQSLAAEMDARGHLSTGPLRTGFKADMAEHGLRTALKNRDAGFGDGYARVRHAD